MAGGFPSSNQSNVGTLVMADVLVMRTGSDAMAGQNQAAVHISAGTEWDCWICGKEETCCVVRSGEDAIAAVGYVSYINGDSVSSTLSDILGSFHESQIGYLKKKLIGQYVLLIKKGQHIYLFSDFMGSRNLFYSDDKIIVSSSYSKIENLLTTSSSDLDINKVIEYLAMKHVHYPTWIGRTTGHRRIKWLLPYEYIAINIASSSIRLGSIVYEIDNKKQSDCSLLSNALLSSLRAIVGRREFQDSPVAASLTGGRDSRLIAAVAAEQYTKIRFRTAVSYEKYNSLKDLEVAKKLSKIRGVPLDIFTFVNGRDEERFRELSDGFAPAYNHSITALIDSAATYSLGLGGLYGTELFRPIPQRSIDHYIKIGIENARKSIKVGDDFWKYFREVLYDEFRRTKDHFQLSVDEDRDYIRLFTLLDTARYGSFIISAFNSIGYQLEPYGSYPVFDLAFRVSPTLWGNHKRLSGDALVQKAAMAKLNSRMARILTYSSFRPMLPYSISTMPFYLIGFSFHVVHWMRERSKDIKREKTRLDMPGGYYLSDGWANLFLDRTAKKYGLHIKYS